MNKMLKKKIQYYMDNIFSKGLIALVLFLALISISIVLVISIIVWSLNITTESSFLHQIWEYAMIITDGDPTQGANWSYKLVTQLVVLTGLFITSILIGLLSSTFQNKFNKLREGTSEVVERNHTIIIGWTGQTITILRELIEANLSQKNPCIVILGNVNKSEMDSVIRKNIPDTKNTKIVCRKGNPIDAHDLGRVSLTTCKSIIVLPTRDHGDSDTTTIKIILAIINAPQRKKDKYNIVAQIYNKKNLIVGEIIGGKEVTFIHANDMVAKISVQTCRQPGLSTVYTDLLDFNGVEIYFKKEASLIGKTFEEAVLSYDTSTVIGLLNKEVPILNAKKDSIISSDDELIIISEDNDEIFLSNLYERELTVNIEPLILKDVKKIDSENVLILGWNSTADFIINELNQYESSNSEVMVASNSPEIHNRLKNGEFEMDNQVIKYISSDITDRDSLDKIDFDKYHHVIILSCNRSKREQADANTLLTLIHVRDIAKKNNYSFSIVSEILDTKNRDLIVNKKVDDFIASEKIISFILTQVSERKELNLIFNEIFKAEGSEVYFKSIINYTKAGQSINFYDISKASLRRKEIAIGYRIYSEYHNEKKNYGIVLNPKKSKKYVFNDDDLIIVLAEN